MIDKVQPPHSCERKETTHFAMNPGSMGIAKLGKVEVFALIELERTGHMLREHLFLLNSKMDVDKDVIGSSIYQSLMPDKLHIHNIYRMLVNVLSKYFKLMP